LGFVSVCSSRKSHTGVSRVSLNLHCTARACVNAERAYYSMGGRGSNATDQEPPKTAHDPCAPQGRAGSKPIRAWLRACVRGEPTYILGPRFFGFRVVARHFGLLHTALPQAALDGGGVGVCDHGF